MPSTTEHSARISDPSKYERIRRKNDEFGKGIHVLYGIKKDGKTEVQAIHFDKTKFTAVEAKTWLKDHDYHPIEFVAATEKSDQSIIEHKTFPFHLIQTKEIVDPNTGVAYGIVSGYASTFDNVDRGGDVVLRGAFSKSLDRYKSTGRQIKLHYQHDSNSIIGGIKANNAREDEIGLYVEAELNLGVEKGKEAYLLAKQGVLQDFSIGYSINDYDLEKAQDGMLNRRLKELELWEVSMVGEPMNPKAQITSIKSTAFNVDAISQIETKNQFNEFLIKNLDLLSKKELEKTLRDSGLFSKQAALILASKFGKKQSESVDTKENNNDVETVNELNTLIDLLNKF
jgi:HK97 family phage prohead protease